MFFKILITIYGLASLISFVWLIKLKKDVYEQYQKEVFTYFDRGYKFAEEQFDYWKVSRLKNLISITDRLIQDPYLDNAGVMSEVGELRAEYRELLKEEEAKPGKIHI